MTYTGNMFPSPVIAVSHISLQSLHTPMQRVLYLWVSVWLPLSLLQAVQPCCELMAAGTPAGQEIFLASPAASTAPRLPADNRHEVRTHTDPHRHCGTQTAHRCHPALLAAARMGIDDPPPLPHAVSTVPPGTGASDVVSAPSGYFRIPVPAPPPYLATRRLRI